MDQLLAINIKNSLGKKLKLQKVGKNRSKKLIKEFLVSKAKTAPKAWPYSIEDFDELSEKAALGLTDPQEAEDITALVVEFNQALKGLIPENLSETLFGVDEREPSDFEKSKFIRQYRVIEDPYHVLDLLASGTLSGLEVETLAAFYPELYQEMVSSTLEAITASSGDDVPRSKASALSTLLQVPRLTPAILEVKEDEADGGEVSGLAEAEQTDVQQVTER